MPKAVTLFQCAPASLSLSESLHMAFLHWPHKQTPNATIDAEHGLSEQATVVRWRNNERINLYSQQSGTQSQKIVLLSVTVTLAIMEKWPFKPASLNPTCSCMWKRSDFEHCNSKRSFILLHIVNSKQVFSLNPVPLRDI